MNFIRIPSTNHHCPNTNPAEISKIDFHACDFFHKIQIAINNEMIAKVAR